MRMRTIVAALAVACLLSAGGTSGNKRRLESGGGDRLMDRAGDGQQRLPMEPFAQPDTEYTFIYNAQIAAGLIAQSAEDAQDAQQQAVTRIRCRAQIQFASERHGQLSLQQCEVGQQNEQMSDPQKVQPMQAFEEKTIPEDKQKELQQACQFAYEDGVIRSVQFQDGEQAWAKNIKRAVLNMIQLNLKNAGTEQEQKSSAQRAQRIKQGSSFTIPETTLEGDCQTTYSINKARPVDQYNVTKTINFKKCQQIADVAYGYQTDQPQPQCAQCQQYWAQQQQQSGQQAISTPAEQAQQQLQQQQQAGAQHPCAKCDPKEVKDTELDRSTVVRCQIQGPPSTTATSFGNDNEKYALKRCELLSQYVYRNVKSENGKHGSAMQTVVAATLEARDVRTKAAVAQQIPSLSVAKFETLMYSNEWDVDAKRFFMFGEEQFNGKDQKSPFHQVPNVQQAVQALRKLVKSAQDEQQGIEAHANAELRRLVRMMQMSTQQELKRIEQEGVLQQKETELEQQAKQLFTDALAMCGTHCCVAQLVEKIQKQQISQKKAVQALITLKQLPAPSDAILEQVQALCQSAQVQQKSALKQTCWLTFGALVNELCAHPTEKNAVEALKRGAASAKAAAINAKQSGFFKQDQCPADKKQQYMKSMMAVYMEATCINDKMIALAAIGNAGVENAVPELEQIIKRPQEARVIRCKAIDALRRLRTQMPRKLQSVLLPLFQNTREQPLVRCAAFTLLAQTLPEQAIVDQLMFTIVREPSKQVLAYAYQTMKMMAKSKQPNVQQIARHIKSALKLAKVDEQQLRYSGQWQLPLAYSAKHQEGVFASFGNAISQRSALPEYTHVQLDTQFNEQFAINELKVYAMQQEVEQWYAQIAQKYTQSQGSATRAQRQQQRHSSRLSSIFQALGIKSRRSQQQMDVNSEDDDFDTYKQQAGAQNQQPYAMLAIRTNNVDQAFWALDEHTMSPELQAMVRGESKPSMRALLGEYRKEVQAAIATDVANNYAMIATSAGMPLYVQNTIPALAFIDGSAGVNQKQQRMSPLDMQLQINVQASGRLAHIQKMKCWAPFAVTAVQSTRSGQFNAPLHAEVQYDEQQQQQGGIAINVKLPQQKTRLISAHTLPITYTAEVDAKTGLEREPKNIRTIRSAKLDRLQKVMNIISGRKELAMPLHIQGHYHSAATPSSFAQLVQRMMATENLVQVIYQPGQDSPREAIFRIGASQFMKNSQREQPDAQLHAFYDAEFDSPYECEPEQCEQGECDHCEHFAQQQQRDAQQEMGNTQQRKQQLQRFISAFKQDNVQQYKHALKLSAQTKGGAQDAKAQCEIQAQCDAKLQFCKVKLDAEKVTPNADSAKWALNAQAQLVMPQTVASAHELRQLQQRDGQQQQQQQFIAHAQAQWGADQKQKVEIRVQGSQAHSPQVRRVLQQQEQQQQQLFIKPSTQRAIVQRSAFLNKFKVAAKYVLKPKTLAKIQQAVEMLKSQYYWNSHSQLTGQPIQQNGQVSATINIDPITAQHANISIKTPDQQVYLQDIQLPQRVRPFALIQQHSAAQTHSLGQLFNRFSVNSRAQCTADGQRVQTFDDAEFAAPLSPKCFTVLAKDCSNEQPQFVVLMKKQSGEKKGQFGQKKLKVITPENAIECQPNGHAGNKLICKLNGQQVHEDTEQQQDDQQQPMVHFNNARKSDVTIHVPGISVRFNGRKAWLKLAPQHKQTQCGLCGHYDDSDAQQDEWRMANGQIASSQPEFHRSFTLLDDGEEQCTEQEREQFYQQQKGKQSKQQDANNYFQQLRAFDDGSSSEEADEESLSGYNTNGEQDQEQQQQYWAQKDEQFNGYDDSSEEDNESSAEQFNQLFADESGDQQCCCCCAQSCEQKCGGDSQCAQRCKQQCKQQCKPDSAEQCKQQCKDGQCQQQQKLKTKCKGKSCEREVRPVWKTMVKEEAHAVCFSTQPVKQCPRGAFPAGRASGTSDYESAASQEEDEEEEDEEQQQQQQKEQQPAKTKKVSFVCMDRAKPEARRLLRQLRSGQRRVVDDMSAHGTSYTEQVREPQQCVRTRQRRAGGVRLF